MTEQSPTVVVDTSALLADPDLFSHIAGPADIVLPVVVIKELEGKRSHPELGWAARRVLRSLEDLRVKHGTLAESVPVADLVTVRVEVNHLDTQSVPEVLLSDSNDNRLLRVAHNLRVEGRDVVVWSKDLPMRLVASVAGLPASEPPAPKRLTRWPSIERVDVPTDVISQLHTDRQIDAPGEFAANTCLVLSGPTKSNSALARVHADGSCRIVNPSQALFGVTGRSAEQRFAIDLLADSTVPIVSLAGAAGTGKSSLALAAAAQAAVEPEGPIDRIMVFRPLYAVGGQDLGYLPGDEGDKMDPWAAAVFDVLGSIMHKDAVAEIVRRKTLEVLPLTHIRGRSLTNCFVIVDEAQNLERNVILTALSRLGTGSRIAFTYDVTQRDNLRVGRHDGIASVVADLAGDPLFGHVTLTRSERSPVAALAGRLLEGDR